MLKKKAIILLLAAGHGLNDCIAGYFLARLVHLKSDLLQISAGLLLYNLLAFGGQYPVALILEKWRKPKQFLLIAYGLNILAVGLFATVPSISIFLAGIASAIYHVAGATVCARENKAVNIGLFAAPGVAGLIAGGYLAYQGFNMISIFLLGAFVIISMLALISIDPTPATHEREVNDGQKHSLDNHDLIMIGLLTFISLRSVIWNVFQLIEENNYAWLIAIAASAFAGKILGGWIADRIGWKLYTFISLLAATPLITLFRKEIILFCIGIGLLQSSIPATTSLLIQAMKGKTERAVSLSFGTAIFIGAILFYLVQNIITGFVPWLSLILLLMLLVLFTISYRRKKKIYGGNIL